MCIYLQFNTRKQLKFRHFYIVYYIILGSPKGICHSHTSAWNWGGFSNYFIKEHSNMVTTTCFSHVGGFFTGINACRTHGSYYHVSIHFSQF